MAYGRRGKFTKPPPGVPLDPSHRLAQGLVGCWLINEGAGSKLIDLSPGRNHGTLTDFNYTAASGWVGGPRCHALNFYGTNDYVITPATQVLAGSPGLTVHAWVLPGSFTTDMIVSQGSLNSIAEYVFFLRLETSTTIRWGISDGTNQLQFVPTVPTMVTTRFQHVAATWSPTRMAVYVNGVLADSTSTSIPASLHTVATSMRIGNEARLQSAAFFFGLMGDVRLYNRALSAGEVAELARAEYAEFLWPAARRYFVAAGGTTYEDTLSLAVDAALAEAGLLSMSPALSLTADAAVAESGPLSMSPAAALTADAATTQAGALAMSVLASLAGDATLAPVGLLDLSALVTLTGDAVQAQAGGSEFSDTLTFDVTAAQAQAFEYLMNAATTLGVDASMDETAILDAAGTLSLAVGAQIEAAAAGVFSRLVSLGVSAATAQTAAQQMQASLTLAVAGLIELAGTVPVGADVIKVRFLSELLRRVRATGETYRQTGAQDEELIG